MLNPSPHLWALVAGLSVGASGCTPALNWREVRHDMAPARVLMPCKPDVAERQIALREQVTVLYMQACAAQGFDFSFAAMALPPGWSSAQVLQAWQQASLATWGVRAQGVQAQTMSIMGASSDASPIQWTVHASSRHVRSLWFAADGWVYQTAVYAPIQSRDVQSVAETYFSGVSLP
ncbi:MAG: hypothetical protein EBQ82_09030 [Betaproteobacteria bacterium]|nr:hypothetical protein [Betaproteobacteria bacterium]NBY05511.1 hypothetical protein [Betaproteobacteria bacterium]